MPKKQRKNAFELEPLNGILMTRNGKKNGKPEWGGLRCLRCELPLDPARALWFRFHHGGMSVVTLDEGDRLNAAGEEGGDMGCHPVGPECAKKIPKEFWLDAETLAGLRKMAVEQAARFKR